MAKIIINYYVEFEYVQTVWLYSIINWVER